MARSSFARALAGLLLVLPGACQTPSGSAAVDDPAPASNATIACAAAAACQKVAVDPATQTCVSSALPDGTACDDGSVCTRQDSCRAGACVGADPQVCSGNNICGLPSACSPLSGCPAPGGPCVVSLGGCIAEVFSVPVSVGGGAPMSLYLDTGSSSVGVASSLCSNCNVTPVYAPGSSATATGQAADAGYGGGSASSGFHGTVYQDTVTLTGGPPVTMRLVAISSQTNFLTGDVCAPVAGHTPGFQGIFGLGPPSLAAPHTDAYAQVLANAGAVGHSFALGLCDSGGTLWLGGFDPAYATTAVQYTPLSIGTSGMTYSVAVADMGIGGVSLGLSSSTYGASDVDSGTTVMMLPNAAYSALVAAIEANATFAANFGSGFFASDGCTAAANGVARADLDRLLPAMTVTLPGVGSHAAPFTLTLPPTHSYLFVASGTDARGQTVYCGALQAGQPTVLGAAFMRSQLAVFDVYNSQVGFAPQRGCPT